ncbi:uncharacterized protein ACNLHF_018613 isoform 1-T2 [Anomaloglossus baeobatrachus]|uniref:uncharacterized protein LOC142311229 n=1 Tax=Anomaloglossus baeobatrachus TaxID=238106 RepID=UPI003F50C108
MEDQTPPTSPDGSIKRITPERCQSPNLEDWSEEDKVDNVVKEELDDDVPQKNDHIPKDDANVLQYDDHVLQSDDSDANDPQDDDHVLQDSEIDDLVIVKVEEIESDEGSGRSEGHHMEDYSTDSSQAKAMVRKQLTTQQRDLIVESYQSGEGYKKISKSLDIPWNTVKTVIKKWHKFGTTVTLPRTGRPSKIDEKTRRKLVREAAKRPTATLKELQKFLASTGCVLHVTTISRILHMSDMAGR